MQSAKVCFIGGGNMARALIGGLRSSVGSGLAITVAEPDPDKRDQLAAQFGVTATADNAEAVCGAQIVVLAVKPQRMHEVASALAPALKADQLVVSVAAGIRVAALSDWLGGHDAVVRAMPNTPSLIGCGAAGLFASPDVRDGQRSEAESLMRAVGTVQWVEREELMDSVTALSGSGPAYLFLVMEAMQDAGKRMGLDAAAARLLTLETVFGAARLAMESSDPPEILRARVTSPGGTTEQGIAALEEAGLREAFVKATEAARARSRALAEQLEND
ncbi:MAG: pyrroline-5-carboxylate reductase [Halothiobacillaceae bacterium]